MIIDVNKDELILLIKSVKPSQEKCKSLESRDLMFIRCITECGGSDYRWIDANLEKCSEEELWALYYEELKNRNERSEEEKKMIEEMGPDIYFDKLLIERLKKACSVE